MEEVPQPEEAVTEWLEGIENVDEVVEDVEVANAGVNSEEDDDDTCVGTDPARSMSYKV